MSTIYADAEEFGTIFSQLLEEIQTADPRGLKSITDSRMVVLFKVTEPDVDVWIDGRSTPVAVSYGEQNLKPTLTGSMTGVTLHEILLGTLPLGKAVSSKRLKVKGSIFKAFKLQDLFHQCQARYPQLVAG